MPQFDSIPAMIDECFEHDKSRENKWYEGYKTTYQKVKASPESEEVLELLWYARDNYVSSLRQGNTSRKEFEDAKARLSALTARIIDSPTSDMYEIAVEELEQLKNEGIFRYFYGALLNRVFAAIAPTIVTSSVKEHAFIQAANFINDHFELKLSLQGNWFQNNLELKNALRQRLSDNYDDFKINIAVWNVYELLEEEKSAANKPADLDKSASTSCFILQGNPQRFDIDEYVASNINIFWTASRFASDMALGDIIYIWRSGQDSGVIAKGKINVLPQTVKQLKQSEYLGQDLWLDTDEAEDTKKVGVQLEGFRLTSKKGMLKREKFKQDKTLNSSLIIKSPQGTVFKLTQSEAERLGELWSAKQVLEDKEGQSVKEKSTQYSTKMSLNQIFYGPPGTGKTYHTIEAAVRAAEPEYIVGSRKDLKASYDALVAQQRIQFVTFHQSFSYEEFIEGLRATTEDGQISYEVKSGIFKRLCAKAFSNINQTYNSPREDFDACWQWFLDGFDHENGETIKTKKSSFLVTEITETTIHFEKAQGKSKHTLSISTLKEIFNGTREITGGLNVYYEPLVQHLNNIVENAFGIIEPLQNYVLVIDEINRGNISKIFGELITLIEDSKRSFNDANETIEITLPYSNEKFSVPNNLYIIGTMNTADRSLAMIDTALRRRFNFVEMMPDYSLLTGIEVKGIALDTLLQKMNARIEALYDREHTLGHAFLIPVKNALLDSGQENAFSLLKETFINKFIPLLEEYFFDDWNKIRLVLGDNQKPEKLQFVKKVTHSYDEIFGSEHGLEAFVEEAQSFDLAPPDQDVWDMPEAYIGIFSVVTEY